MKKLLCLVLAMLTVLSLAACGSGDPGETTKISAYKSKGTYTELGEEKLSWEGGLNALPKKYPGMSTEEARQAVMDFWYYVKTALWIPDARYDIYKDNELVEGQRDWKRCVEAGMVYGGLPYVSSATGSIYRLMDYIDEETGVVDITSAGFYPKQLGGMCSSGCYWAWARVMNSADYRWCADSVASRGYIPVGPYTYDLTITRLIEDGDQGTDNICRANGEQVMFQSYANMKKADGFITLYEKNGHTLMCSIDPVVIYHEDGTINGDESFMHIIDQGAIWVEATSPNGIPYRYERNMDKKFTFRQLYDDAKIPFTFGELIGTDPIEETECSFSYTGETITKSQLFKSKVTSNYNIADVYVIICDSKGNEVYKHADRVTVPSTREVKISKVKDRTVDWGSLNDLNPGKENYTLTVEVQLGTGERPVVYTGRYIG